MIIRIVKMTFAPEHVATFKELFQQQKDKIRAFDGCEHLELWQDRSQTNVFFTYSYWRDDEALAAYRQSALFRETWAETKQLFAAKPEAWSVEQVAVCE
ncbi:MAG: antibiotic biosynthesis monooxygenase [Bacteroidetes bacterium SW_11_45_7]|nr:MAG: antibiotic biosynthesis monooxygenase [Bacteroidetes bacterium SW_11_45_7]